MRPFDLPQAPRPRVPSAPTARRTRSSTTASACFGALAVFVMAAQPSAQHMLYELRGSQVDDNFGRSVDGAGDVDQDGFDDVIIGAQDSQRGAPNGNHAAVFSGRTGRVLHTFRGDLPGDFFGYAVGRAGDVDRDGYGDVVVGAREIGTSERGYARVFSGRTGATLHTFRGDATGDHFGICVGGAGDIDGDGHDDLIVGADRANNDTGYARVLSGRTGAILFTFHGPASGSRFGHSARSAGDVDSDGVPDLVIGAPEATRSPAGADGYAEVRSGLDGRVLHSWWGPAANAYFGFVAAAGDVDGDGHGDVVIGAPWAPAPGGALTGSATVYSGRSGAAIHTWYGANHLETFGLAVAKVGDLDGDGRPDIVVGSAEGLDPAGLDTGYARVFSGRTGAVIVTHYGRTSREQFGFAVGGAGDTNGDSVPDLVVGAIWWGGRSHIGRAEILSGAHLALTADVHRISSSAGGAQQLVLDAGPAHAGKPYLVLGSMSGVRPGTPLGTKTLPLNVDPYLLFSAAYPNVLVANSLGVLDGSGRARARFRLPGGLVSPGPAGTLLDHAFVAVGAGLSFDVVSNSVPLTLER